MERHPVDVLSLFAGVVFVGIALVGLTGMVTVRLTDLRWLAPLVLVGFGVVLLVTAGGRRTDRGDATGRGTSGAYRPEPRRDGMDGPTSPAADTRDVADPGVDPDR